MRRALLLCVVAVAAGCLGGSDPAPPADPHLGVTVRLPSGWAIHWRPCRGCVDPRGVFDAGSASLVHGCAEPAPGEVAVSLTELVPGRLGQPPASELRWPARPAHFAIGALSTGQVRKGCDLPRTRLFRFRDGERFLYAWVVFGPRPTREVRHEAASLLDSLRAAPLSGS